MLPEDVREFVLAMNNHFCVQFEFLLNSTIPFQFAFRRCYKMNVIVERAGHCGGLLGERYVEILHIKH